MRTAIGKIEAMQRGLVSRAQIAKRTGVNEVQIHCYIASGLFPRPHHRIGKRLFYTIAEANDVIKAIAKYRQLDLSTIELFRVVEL